MVSLPDEIQAQLATLRQAYAQQLLGRVEQIATTWQQLSRRWDDTMLATLHRMTHNLAGSGATFGFAAISDRARALECLLQTIMESRNQITQEEGDQITALLELLQLAAAEPNSPTVMAELEHIPPVVMPPTYPPDERLIFFVKDTPDLTSDLVQQLSYFGYRVQTFASLKALQEAVHDTTPAAIIVDVRASEGSFAGTEMIKQIQQRRETPIPVVFLSIRSDLVARLQAVQSGGYAYFTKPVEIGTLIDKLDALSAHQSPDPYRILIVDDESTLASYYAYTLQQAGMKTFVVSDPLQVLQPLVDFRPDLILMDVYMPSCNGLELAAVIRQLESYLSIPIVFLSTETNLDRQLAAMSLGGDDFLMKPIHPHHLIRAVSSRAQRSRLLRSYMIKDSLTGLLNHTKTKEQLMIEVSRAQRRQRPLTFAMIDIDHFKSINDSYGHAIGDRVITSLSRLLQQRLRKTDVIGRYGGEEFAVILPETDGVAATPVLNELRAGFAQIRHQAADREFAVTFSCGLAVYPQYPEATSLSDAADKALYLAKAQGRDRVILAQPKEFA
ncbi:diguanylate cyclase [Neosynechococcus sphagnicola sy1]|uniref:Diguanylate cyclase n=1 Tax=Neosynechococcus sphagnicola sy1 TaxID=1497020 RepID=A0A098THR1_9CYAN|nr:diguanylate cyclase [Neosynechococcus sphagnicola]KGF72090.1 diguanylate cyclase [Neosynechococcus sphagnicola sy1]